MQRYLWRASGPVLAAAVLIALALGCGGSGAAREKGGKDKDDKTEVPAETFQSVLEGELAKAGLSLGVSLVDVDGDNLEDALFKAREEKGSRIGLATDVMAAVSGAQWKADKAYIQVGPMLYMSDINDYVKCANAGAQDKKEACAPSPVSYAEKAAIHSDMPAAEFKLVFAGKNNYLDRIEYRSAGAAPPQSILFADVLKTRDVDFSIEDMDFDGYADLRLLVTEKGRGVREQYLYWLFDKETMQYKPTDMFDSLCSPSFDAASKIISSTCVSSAGLTQAKTFSVSDKKLVLMGQGEVESFSKAGFQVKIFRPMGGGPVSRYVVMDNEGKLVCDTSQKPLTCDPMQVVTLFTLAEENKSAQDMAGYYTDGVVWRGTNKTRSWLLENHAKYLRSIKAYDMSIYNLREEYSETGDKAMVECTVDGSLTNNFGEVVEYGVDKRFRLVKVGEEWKIECEEVSKFNHIDIPDSTDKCKL